ncbi:NADH dehydrogenase [ubiquinone] 1 beta subcomplex subunit 2, mitochondrial-like [Homarus americanus]|uniref:NADH dehydrogenase [ubiquinone] 1 beta subcomplex subunit 2-like n=1 Tax=Homarus americanus TaxID=6706 RepID=A0A8J5KLB5_HOMAM|nr:NADH dehydrogenase [ubiquinone] 1 beta subcomplex subunit 2, mitochondrial-like [Homarus americanus]XP_042220033.1 NADH dehydrogenase [ubiquinone] 1 beta subcomplex subunit 2, mitochondrial-like [Homarus americanus]KAG7169989.1 NADH dehydrogenase [ubiquinone] 1 beta subcomplex subunit 2-like [Homarus americanus]
MFPLRRAIKHVPALCRGFKTSIPRQGGGTWTYRTSPEAPEKVTLLKAEVLGGFMWWWILYHVFTEPEHLTGEFPFPDPSKWTNSELGIPADDED